jgi:hypothetical protein
MLSNEINNSLKIASQQLQNAENELNRPHEDVVTLSACQNVRNSMRDMMRLYLSARSIASDPNSSLSELMGSCIRANRAFIEVDISNIECKGLGHSQCDGKYCLAIENVACCLNAGKQVKNIVWKELNVN